MRWEHRRGRPGPWPPSRPGLVSVHRASQSAMIRVTLSAASCCTKWLAFGIVTSVSSASIQFQRIIECAGQEGGVSKAVDHQHRAFDLRRSRSGLSW